MPLPQVSCTFFIVFPSIILITHTEDELKVLQLHERTGRPLGSAGFVGEMEQSLGRIYILKNQAPKRKRRRVEYTVPGTSDGVLLHLLIIQTPILHWCLILNKVTDREPLIDDYLDNDILEIAYDG